MNDRITEFWELLRKTNKKKLSLRWIERKLDDIQSIRHTMFCLGVTIDNTLSFDEHVANVCKAAHFHMRALRHIRKCIDDDTAKTIASSVIGARLDYCNSVLYIRCIKCQHRQITASPELVGSDSQACPSLWSHHTSPDRTALAADKIAHPV